MWVLMFLTASGALLVWWLQERARWHRLWLDEMHGARSDTLGVGISVLVAGEPSLHRYERLLGVEYARLEVVAVVDGGVQGALLERVIARYHLIRVGYHPSGELPVRGVQGLYRSRRRRYRRFVLLDCRAVGEKSQLDAAADVASYDYLLPLRGAELPAVGTIEALAAEMALRPIGRVDQLCLLPSLRTLLWRRVALVRQGGFASGCGLLPTAERRVLWWGSPLRERSCAKWRSLLVYSALLLVFSFVWGLSVGRWQLLVGWLFTLLLVLLVRLRTAQIRREYPAL